MNPDSTLAASNSPPDSKTDAASPGGRKPGLLRAFIARLRCLTIYRIIAISVAVIMIVGALIGTLLTRYLSMRLVGLPVLLLVVAAGMAFSVFVACRVASFALQPLRDLHLLVREAKNRRSRIDERRLASSDPQIRGLARDLNAVIDELHQSNAQMKALSGHAINAQEDERKRIARTLHDETGQSLTMLIVNLERIESGLSGGDAELQRKLADARFLASQVLSSLRNIVHGLRPAILDDLGLVPAIRWYARTNLEQAGIRLEFVAPDESFQLSSRLNTTLFRIAQESVNNIVRHSAATQAIITLKSSTTEVCLQIEDDGVGFSLQDDGASNVRRGHWGLAGIQERVSLVNGQVDMISEPGVGTIIQVRVPLDFEGEPVNG